MRQGGAQPGVVTGFGFPLVTEKLTEMEKYGTCSGYWLEYLVITLAQALHRKNVFLARTARRSFSVCHSHDALSRSLKNGRGVASAIFFPT